MHVFSSQASYHNTYPIAHTWGTNI
jgi:hypothetical protein